jgi:hypothetical protein
MKTQVYYKYKKKDTIMWDSKQKELTSKIIQVETVHGLEGNQFGTGHGSTSKHQETQLIEAVLGTSRKSLPTRA